MNCALDEGVPTTRQTEMKGICRGMDFACANRLESFPCISLETARQA